MAQYKPTYGHSNNNKNATRKSSSSFHQKPWMWMGVVTIWFCQSFFLFTLAFSVPRPRSSPLQRFPKHPSTSSVVFVVPYGGGGGGGTSTSTSTKNLLVRLAESTSNEGSEGGATASNERVPATGWNHNQPSDSSNFWQSTGGNSNLKKDEDNGVKKEPRTGWLHNTESKQKQKEKAAAGAGGGDKNSSTGGGISKAQARLQQAMLQQERNHRIISSPTFHACGNDRVIVVTEHRLSVPTFRPNKVPRLDVAFNIVEEVKDDETRVWFESLQSLSPKQRAMAYIEKASLKDANDMMIYLQGGPGFGSPTPVVGLGFGQGSSWGAAALGKYKRIVLMDQRGTGKSTPITKQSLEKKFPDLFLFDADDDDNDNNNNVDDNDDETTINSINLDILRQSKSEERVEKFELALKEATEYMAQFRADNIVKDAEYIREALMVPEEPGSPKPGPRPWGCALGQSFGGFCLMSYLSLIDHPPKICLFTGGIAPMLTPVYDVYSKLWTRVRERNLVYYDMYPDDVQIVKKIIHRLVNGPTMPTLPSGGKLTARRFLQLGMALGGNPTSFASMHNLLSNAFLHNDGSDEEEVVPEFTRGFLKAVDNAQPFDEHPIYFWLHESIYADGTAKSNTNWAAHRAYQDKVKELPKVYDYRTTCQGSTGSNDGSDDDVVHPTLFFGEMVFPWMSKDYAECDGIGCTMLANALASKNDWGPLYDGEHMRFVLGSSSSSSTGNDGTVQARSRAAAAVYYDDLYVDFDSSMKVASRGGPLEKCKVYVTNDYQHSGLRDDGAAMFTKLHGMAMGSVRTPS